MPRILVVDDDENIPGLSGLELLGHIRQKYVNTPVIIISGISDEEHAQGLIRLGAFDFLLKPFRLEVVEKSVERAVNYRQHLVEDAEEKQSDGGEPDQWNIVKDDAA
jgi:DNA-binding NtrC family response regulator